MGKNVVIVLALLAAGFFAAYLRFRPHLGLESAYTDGVRRYGSVEEAAGLRFAVWDDSEPLSDEVNTVADEARPTLSPDGDWLVFTAGERGLNADLFVARMRGGEAVEPRPLVELNSDFDDLAPAFAHDALWFASDRSGGVGGLDLWRAAYSGGRFGEPELVAGALNTTYDESDPAPLAGSRALAFASDRSGDWDLFLAKPGPDEPGQDAWQVEPLEEVSSPFDDREPTFTAGGLGLVFSSDRPGGEGGFDLWRSVREDGRWRAAELIVGIGSPLDERGPWSSPDGFTLFHSRNGDRGSDLYRAESRELYRLPGRPVGWLDLVILSALLLLALLAWLAKRWQQLEILYKCFLASIAVHLALLLWFRTVGVEGESLELPDRAALFRVQLATSGSDARSALEERGGALAREREERELPGSPRRAESDRLAAARAESRVETVRPSESPGDSAPARATRAELDPSERSPAEVALAEREARSEPRRAAAPVLELAPSPTMVGRTPAVVVARRTDSAVRPAHDERPTPRGAPLSILDVATRVGSFAESEVARPDRRTESAEAPSGAGRGEVAVELRRPRPDSGGRRELAADALALPEPVSTPRAGESVAAPSRRGAALAVEEGRVAFRPEGSVERVLPVLAPSRTPARPARRSVATGLEPTRVESPEVKLDRQQLSTDELAGRRRVEAPAELALPAPTGHRPATRSLAGPSRHRPDSIAAAVPLPAVARVAAEAPTEVAERSTPSRRLDRTPYRSRFGLEKERALREYGGGIETEEAVASGLAYLARIQNEDGSWGRSGYRADKYFEVGIGKTGLALLAFLGAGHSPASDSEFSSVAERAVSYLLSRQDDETGHFGYSSSYSHGISTYALAECFALTADARLQAPIERAVEQILGEQHDGGGEREGGWGYYYPDGRGSDGWPRVSVTSWQVMALESARLGGIEVPARAFRQARRFLRGSYDRSGWFRYSHDPGRLRSGYPTLPGSTPAALFALSLLGEDVRTPRWREAVEFVTSRTPRSYSYGTDDEFVFRARGNLYFWYYSTLALFRHGGPEWERWNTAMKETLLGAQEDDGSWEPISVYAEYAGDTDRDRSYSTAICVLTLEIYYRYFTPLLEVE